MNYYRCKPYGTIVSHLRIIQHPNRSSHQAFYKFTAHDGEAQATAGGVIFPLDLEFHGPGIEGMEAVFQLRKSQGMRCV